MTDLSTPPMQGLPPMTLEQAVELVNRIRTIQNGGTAFLARNATMDSLLDHAAHGYKAAILLFEHASVTEQHLIEADRRLNETMELLVQLTNIVKRASDDPVSGPLFRALLDPNLTESGEIGAEMPLAHRPETDISCDTPEIDHFQREITPKEPS